MITICVIFLWIALKVLIQVKMLIQQSPKNSENILDLIPRTPASFEILQVCLDAIKDMIGRCEIQGSEVITSNDVGVYVGQTNRFTEQYSFIELHNFLTKCQELATYLLTQNLTEFETVIEESKKNLKQDLPLFCHAYLCIVSHDAQLTLVAVLDRFIHPENTGSNALTILRGRTLDQLGSIEKSSEKSVEKVKVSTLPSLFPANVANGTPKEEASPPEVEGDQLDSDEKTCQALVKEIKSFGPNFWVCQYLEDVGEL